MYCETKLKNLKYRELQKIAKEHKGIKANLPREKLLKELLSVLKKQDGVNVEEQCSKRVSRVSFNIVTPHDSHDAEKSSRISHRVKTPGSKSKHSLSSVNETQSFSGHETPGTEKSGSQSKHLSRVSFNVFTPHNVHDVEKSRRISHRVKTPSSRSNRPTSFDAGDVKSCEMSVIKHQVKATQTPLKRKVSEMEKNLSTVEKKKKISSIPRPLGAKNVPNFAKLHAQQENAMESIDNYLERKQKSVKKTKNDLVPSNLSKAIPQKFDFSSSSELSLQNMKFTDSQNESKFVFKAKSVEKTKKTVQQRRFKEMRCKENISSPSAITKLNGRKQFDLKSSLATKLSYKPHTGKLAVLAEVKKRENTSAVAKDRDERRTNIKGVRMNKRAELLMQRRGVAE